MPVEALRDEQVVDLVLRQRFVLRRLAGEDALGARRGVVEQRGVGEAVVDDDLGLRQAVAAGERQQAGVAGSGADQGDEAAHRSRASRLSRRRAQAARRGAYRGVLHRRSRRPARRGR